MRTFNRISAFILLSTLFLGPATLRAAVGEPPREARELADAPFSEVVKRAQNAYSNGELDRAIRLLVRAYSMRSNARLLFNIAKSYEKKNRCATALVYYRAYINHPGTEKKLMDAAEKQMEKKTDCDGYTDDLAGRLMVGSTPEGARVVVDGTPRGWTPTDVAPLESGSHKLVIQKKGYEPVSINLEMESGEKKEINQILQEKKPEKPKTDNGNGGSGDGNGKNNGGPKPTPRSSIFWPIHPAALALGGGGVGGLTVGAVYDLVIIPSTDDKRRDARGDADRFQRLTDQRDTQKTIALVGYLGGGLLLTSGIVWHAIDVANEPSPSKQAASDRTPRWTWGASPQSVQLQIRFY